MPPRERFAAAWTEALIRDGAILVDAKRSLHPGAILHEAGRRAGADPAGRDAPLRCCGMSREPAITDPFTRMLR